MWTGIQSGGSNVVTKETREEDNDDDDDDAAAGPSGVVDTGVTKPLEPAFEKPTEPIDIFPGKIEKLLNSISKVCPMSISRIGYSERKEFVYTGERIYKFFGERERFSHLLLFAPIRIVLRLSINYRYFFCANIDEITLSLLHPKGTLQILGHVLDCIIDIGQITS